MMDFKLPFTSIGTFLGFAVGVVAVIAVAKMVPGIKSIV